MWVVPQPRGSPFLHRTPSRKHHSPLSNSVFLLFSATTTALWATTPNSFYPPRNLVLSFDCHPNSCTRAGAKGDSGTAKTAPISPHDDDNDDQHDNDSIRLCVLLHLPFCILRPISIYSKKLCTHNILILFRIYQIFPDTFFIHVTSLIMKHRYAYRDTKISAKRFSFSFNILLIPVSLTIFDYSAIV